MDLDYEELKVMRQWVVLWACLCTVFDLISREQSFLNKIFRFGFYVHTLYLIASCVLSYRMCPSYIKSALLSMNIRLILVIILYRDNAILALEQETNEVRLYGLAIVMGRLYFSLVSLLVNSIMCVSLL